MEDLSYTVRTKRDFRRCATPHAMDAERLITKGGTVWLARDDQGHTSVLCEACHGEVEAKRAAGETVRCESCQWNHRIAQREMENARTA